MLTLLLQPLGSALLLLLAGTLLRRWRPRGGRVLQVLGVAWLWAWSTPVVSESLRGALERQHPAVPAAAAPQADAILILGGSAEDARPPERPDPDYNGAVDRVLYGAALFHAGRAPRIVLSGGHPTWVAGQRSESQIAEELLLRLGIPAGVIVREDASLTTRENAAYTAGLLRAQGIGSVLLVTSALHMPRAVATFAAAGVATIPAPTDVTVAAGRPRTVLDYLPDARALATSGDAFRELLGMLHLQVFGVRE